MMTTKVPNPRFSADLTERLAPKPQLPRRPRLVCECGEIVADAVVIVSPCDPNWRYANGEVRVRR
jgi:hypothetical protein